MNVLVISDYGITDITDLNEVVLDDCIDLNSVQYVIYSAGYASIVPFALQHEKVKKCYFEINKFKEGGREVGREGGKVDSNKNKKG